MATLEDYEVGTWTPMLDGVSLHYTRIGSVIYIDNEVYLGWKFVEARFVDEDLLMDEGL